MSLFRQGVSLGYPEDFKYWNPGFSGITLASGSNIMVHILEINKKIPLPSFYVTFVYRKNIKNFFLSPSLYFKQEQACILNQF
jgi:hypothetical protein